MKKRPKGDHLIVQYAVGALDEGSVEEHIPVRRERERSLCSKTN